MYSPVLDDTGPDLQNLYEHFKTLNNSDNNNNEDENEDDIINNPSVHENNNCLKCPLTVDERPGNLAT